MRLVTVSSLDMRQEGWLLDGWIIEGRMRKLDHVRRIRIARSSILYEISCHYVLWRIFDGGQIEHLVDTEFVGGDVWRL